MLSRRLRCLLAALLVLGCLTATTAPRAQTTLKWAHVYEISEPYHTWALWAADEIAKRTDGRYKVEVFPASSLGKESDINEGLGLGTVDIIYTGQLFAGRFYGPIAIGGAPFVFRDYDHWAKFRDERPVSRARRRLQKATGNHVVTLTYYGERQTTSNKEILKPEDMAGLKIRVPDAPLYKMFPEAVGANPTPIAFAEVYLALQTGTVDAQENPLPTIQAKKFYEVQKYIALTGHITDALLTIVSGQTWDCDVRTRTRRSSPPCSVRRPRSARQDIIKKQDELAAWFEQQGVTVNKVDRGPFREAVVKLHNGPAATWDQATYDKLQAIR